MTLPRGFRRFVAFFFVPIAVLLILGGSLSAQVGLGPGSGAFEPRGDRGGHPPQHSPEDTLGGMASGEGVLPGSPGQEKAELGFALLHTSDMHGRIAPQSDPLATGTLRPPVGGFAALKTCVDRWRQEVLRQGGLPLLLDSGDYFQGTPVVDETKGECMIALMNHLGYVAMAIGNHDFDYGLPRLSEMQALTRCPVLCANLVRHEAGVLPRVRSHASFSWRGRTIALIGILTPETHRITFEANLRGIELVDPVPVVNALAGRLRQDGVNAVVLLSHCGIEEDRRMAPLLRGIDAILGGHSHTTMVSPGLFERKPIPIIHSGFDNRYASRVELWFPPAGGAPEVRFEPVTTSVADYPEDPATQKLVQDFSAPVDRMMKERIGESQVDLFRGVIGGDSPEGAWVADAMALSTKADFAFINAGGLRCPILRGPITREDIFQLQPFDNHVEVLPMTGTQIREMIEHSLSVPFSPVTQEDLDYAIQNFRMTAKGLKREFQGNYGYLIPANLHFTFDPERPEMDRLTKLTDKAGQDLVPDKTYRVALNNYMSSGGDGYAYLKDWKTREVSPAKVRDLLFRRVTEDGGIKALPEVRITNLKLTTGPLTGCPAPPALSPAQGEGVRGTP